MTLTTQPTPAPPEIPRSTRHRGTLARPRARGITALVAIGALLALSVWALADLRINIATLVDSAGNAADFAGRMFPLDFPDVGELLTLTGTTLSVVVCATLLSVLISLPVAVLAAGNTSPHTGARLVSRGVIVAARAIPDVVLAIVFFRLFGLGTLAGVLAMGLHSVGMVGKLYADAIEQIDEGPRTAVRAGGAGRAQELMSGVLPQVAPSLIATGLHRFDINLRISVVLGFVGVDGLGFAMAMAFKRLDYQRGMALALIVLLLCVVVELLSGMLRRALLRPSGRATRRIGSASTTGRVSPPWTLRRLRRMTYGLVTALVVLAAVWGAELSPGQFFGAFGDIGTVVQLFWPPDTGGMMPQLWADLLITIQIALAATLIGAVLALPIGSLAARNVAPSSVVGQVFRSVIVFVRGVPELVLAIVFVVVIGLGPVAGALALAIGTVGLLGKLVADSLEEVDLAVEDAVRATGARRWQVYFAATLPQAAPAFVGHLLYQLDVNIRSATLLGIVGAGGIGFHLLNASRVLEYGVVTTVMLMLFATVLLVELIALWLRRVVR